MMRAARAEAFARLLEGDAPTGRHAAEALALAGVGLALGKLPAPTLPAGLAAGRASFMQAATAHVAAAASVAPATATATATATGTATKVAGSARAGAGHVIGGKAGIFSLLGGHLVPLAAGTAVVAVGAAGIAVGTSRSLPGDPLYGVKRSVESLQVRTAGGRVSTAEEQLAQAGTRLQEAAALRQRAGGATHIPGEVNAWVASESAAVTVLLPLVTQPGIRAELTSFLASQSAGLATMPPASVKAATDALATLAAGLGLPNPSAATRPSPPLTNPLSPPATPSPLRATTPTTPKPGLPTALATPAARGGQLTLPTTPATSVGTTTPATSVGTTTPAASVGRTYPATPAAVPPSAGPAGVPSLPTHPSVANTSGPIGAPVPSSVPTDILGTIARLLPTSLPTPS